MSGLIQSQDNYTERAIKAGTQRAQQECTGTDIRVEFFTRGELNHRQHEGRRETRWVVLCEMDWASCGLGIWHKLEGQGLKYARNSAEGNKQSQEGG